MRRGLSKQIDFISHPMLRDWFNRIFPVRIQRQHNVLLIKDSRPSDIFLLSVIVGVGSLLMSGFLGGWLIAGGIYWPFLVFFLPAPIFIVKALMSPLRAVHVFDKSKDAYSFTTRTVLKSESTEGILSEVRGTQVERRVNTSYDDNRTTESYRAVLLLKQGLLFGTPDVQPLREDSAMGAYYETENQIAGEIAGFLELGNADVVDL